MKVKIKTVLKANNEIIEHETTGILLKNQLQYAENNTKVKIDFLNCEMIREDNDKKLVYKLKENEKTVNKVLIKNPNLSLDLSIFTNYFKKGSTWCDIKYELIEEKQTISYKISWEEIR